MVETRSGVTHHHDAEEAAPSLGRARRPRTPVVEEPLVQVETQK
jgi:hypothetical protein